MHYLGCGNNANDRNSEIVANVSIIQGDNTNFSHAADFNTTKREIRNFRNGA